eukprot:scaffold122461_cov27-Tisochrysis_lutea.AAC.2
MEGAFISPAVKAGFSPSTTSFEGLGERGSPSCACAVASSAFAVSPPEGACARSPGCDVGDAGAGAGALVASEVEG